ncbi:MAG: hypothetical protein EB015_20940 [Methylocystaceae bacterium]|nr:hypothetical protein [Methylocystaceae bacterium]
MAILRSYKCLEHGYFDAWEPLCPHGCLDVAVVILKAPSMRDSTRAAKSKMVDTTAKGLAKEFKMTNIKTTREGEFQEGYHTRNNQTKESRPGDAVMWGGGGRFNMASVLSGSAIQSVGGEPIGANPKDLNLTKGPQPGWVQHDQEGLKIK